MQLALCMVVKDEARNLPACLDSVRELVSEIVVVDTGSVDETPVIARRYGAQVIPFAFSRVDFSAARNCALEHAKAGWIFVLDADETLEPESAPRLRELLHEQSNTAYYVERINFSSGTQQPNRDHLVRLFRNHPKHRYRGRVHETIDASIEANGGVLRETGIRIRHSFADDAAGRRRKNLWYIEILNEEIAADPADSTRLDFLAAEYHQLGRFDEAAAVAQRIVELRPRDARAHLFVGAYHLLYQSKPSQAQLDFENALRLRPNYPEALEFLELAKTAIDRLRHNISSCDPST